LVASYDLRPGNGAGFKGKGGRRQSVGIIQEGREKEKTEHTMERECCPDPHGAYWSGLGMLLLGVLPKRSWGTSRPRYQTCPLHPQYTGRMSKLVSRG